MRRNVVTVSLIRPDVEFLDEGQGRMRVVDFEEEISYLVTASQPLKDIARIILDTGLRPDEVFRIRVENLDFTGRTIFNPFGKTKASRRKVTMTRRYLNYSRSERQRQEVPSSFRPGSIITRQIGSVRKGARCRRGKCGYQGAFQVVRPPPHVRDKSSCGGRRSSNSRRDLRSHHYSDDDAICSPGRGTKAPCIRKA